MELEAPGARASRCIPEVIRWSHPLGLGYHRPSPHQARFPTDQNNVDTCTHTRTQSSFLRFKTIYFYQANLISFPVRGPTQVVRLHQLLHEVRFDDPKGDHLSPAGRYARLWVWD